MTTKTTICLYREHVTNLRATIKFAESHSCDTIITPIVNPLFYPEFEHLPICQHHIRFTRSELVLEPSVWLNKVVPKLSDSIDCDSVDRNVRKHSALVLKREIAYSQHLSSYGYTLIRLRGTNTLNMAKILMSELQGTLLVEVPMVDPKLQSQVHRKNQNVDEYIGEDTWNWWNKFRTYANYSVKFKVALELSADLSSSEELLRWLGEPIELIIIPSEIFILNSSNYPVLSKAHKAVVLEFLKMRVNFAIKSYSDEDHNLTNYTNYLRHLVTESNKLVDTMQGYEDLIEVPLQPLYDNLDSYTYEIFEKDPVKYMLYQKAIERALIDKIPEKDIKTKTAIVMVVGAGRGPLVRSAINASANTKRKIKIFVIEKNPNAIVTLSSLKRELWPNEDLTIISTDMREFMPVEKADILVSELLGSFGDNELSPECLDGAQKHLKPDGISIPSQSRSYLNPVMSSKLLNIIREIRPRMHQDKPSTYETQSESPYVVYLKNAYHIADAKLVFTFNHPNRSNNIDNSRYAKLHFTIPQDCVLTGFAGYFDTVLYDDIILSIHPETHSKGLSSWFSMYFPLAEPQQLRRGDELQMNIWRCVGPNKVWYEWNTTAPLITHIHNLKGKSAPIYK